MSEIMKLIIFIFLCRRAVLGVAHVQRKPLYITGMDTKSLAQNPENNMQEPVVQDVQKNSTVDQKVPEIKKILARAINEEENIQEADTEKLNQKFGNEGGLKLKQRWNYPLALLGEVGGLVQGIFEYALKGSQNSGAGNSKGRKNYAKHYEDYDY
ncbi:uncharacterized protein [Halyomorpha halys]|uniref:uncharacterized protein n=1 Tax=Halyomorpha halys TaxID=286706 RepID=UPI0006D50110